MFKVHQGTGLLTHSLVTSQVTIRGRIQLECFISRSTHGFLTGSKSQPTTMVLSFPVCGPPKAAERAEPQRLFRTEIEMAREPCKLQIKG